MEKIYSRTKTIQEDKVSGFCPGCMHSTVVKLIGEVMEEMDVVEKTVMVTGIGCCGLHMDYIAYDTITAPHGRATAVATGMKRSSPDSLHRPGGVHLRGKPWGEHHRHLHQQRHLRYDRRSAGPHHPAGDEGLHRTQGACG